MTEPIIAGGLIFGVDGYRIDGGAAPATNTLTLMAPSGSNSPAIKVAALNRVTIDALLAGTSGFTKTGNGTLRLTNSSNSISGDVVINGGNLMITNEAQLGTGTTAISVNGIAGSGNPGYSGGSLILMGNTVGAGMTINREISVTGRGPGAVNGSGGLVSVGNNTI
ncbi:autotransporter-associated beta strand repeat-containing protein, partial [Prosthecobacter sp.]|uniref:autotransporter-associated beta strand repeat-containing protein n=1 Tax=Prosthecobacter sp. TaxID=1965333 RepID=UPI0037CAF12F